MAVTVDDLPFVGRAPASAWQPTTDALLACFREHDVPAVGFVNEGKLYPERDSEAPSPERLALLRQWLDAGLELGNHTFAHAGLHDVSAEDFEAGIARGDVFTQRLLEEGDGAPLRYFRHPFLHTGRDAATRARVTSFLSDRGYRVAPVTIDNQEWRVARAYDHALNTDAVEAAARLESFYVEYMDAMVGYWEQQSRALLDREPPQILLIHANRINAATCPALLEVIEARGYRFVTLEAALEDDIWTERRDEYFGPAGISWIHRWALTEGREGAFFAGEPELPDWVTELAEP